jgi:hypothetical protein
VKHIVLCSFRDDLTAEERDEIIAEFASLRESVSWVRALEHGPNVSPEALNDGFTYCFVVDFASAADRDAYLVDPVHATFAARFGPSLSKILVVDFEASPPQAR